MAFYTPSFLSPENTAINATQDNIFSWQPNGDEPQVAFQLFIRKNNDNSLVLDTTKITSNNITYTLPSSTLINGVEYKWQVRVWNTESTYVDSDWILFKAHTIPTVSLSVTNLTVQNYTFVATYNQSEEVLIKNYRFILYDEFDNILLDSDLIYSTTLEYEVTGMITENTYKIECQITDQNEMIATTGKQIFSVSYVLPEDIPELIISSLNEIGAIRLDWTNIKQVLGNIEGDYSYVEGDTTWNNYAFRTWNDL